MANGYRITYVKQNLISGSYAADGTTDHPDLGTPPDTYPALTFGSGLVSYPTGSGSTLSIPLGRIYTLEYRDDL